MRFGTALFLVALGLLALPVVASGLASEGIWSKPREQQAVLVKRERLIDNGRTKVIEFVNERTGKVEYCSAGDPRGRVAVTRRGEGEHEFSVSPYEPTTDAELERMGKLTRRDIRTRQTACPREDGSVPSRRAALGSALMRYALTTCDRQSCRGVSRSNELAEQGPLQAARPRGDWNDPGGKLAADVAHGAYAATDLS